MQRIVRPLLAAILFVLSAGVSAQTTQSRLDDIVAANFKAKGGLEKWKAIQTMKLTAHATIHQQGQSFAGQLAVYLKRPNLGRQELTIQNLTNVSAFDGKTAWAVSPLTGSPAPIVVAGTDAAMIEDELAFDGPLVDYKTKGRVVTLVGTETLAGRRVLHLTITRKDLPLLHYYLDATTYLEARQVMDAGGGAPRLVTDFANYRTVDGIVVPFQINSLQDATPTSELAVDRVEFNVPLDDALFRMPKNSTKTVAYTGKID